MIADVVVIGGGPAGSSAAIRLARAGHKVRLYEKSHFPRAKLCGGFLSPEGLADLEDLNVLSSVRRSGALPLHRMVIASPRGRVIEAPLPDPALSVSREVMDDLLLQEARRAGAEVFEGQDGFSHAGSAPHTVVAAGRLALAKEKISPDQLSPWYGSPPTLYFGIQAQFQNVHGVTDQVELDLVESGYVGLARQGNAVNVCTLTKWDTLRRFGPSLDNVMARFASENPVLRRHLSDASRISNWIAVPVRLGIRRLTHGNTFYTGDAACVVDPFAGEGMSISLYASKLLQKAFSQTERAATEAYAALWREAFLPALRWNALTRVLYSLPLLRQASLRALQWFPHGMNLLTDLTRCRRIAGETA
ncbi:MAG: FAD-dependent oxidoreductase [Tepidisphaeraceae bacterium]